MEEKPEYITEAMDLLESHSAARIESPRVVRELTDDGLKEYKVWGWVKISAKFIAHIKKLKGAKLSIWQTIALSIDEFGTCKLTIKELEDLTGYGHSEITESIKELKSMGYLGVEKTSKGNFYLPEFTARGTNSPTESVFQKVDTAGVVQAHTSRAIEKSPSSIKSIKRVNTDISETMPVEWYIEHDLPIPEGLAEQTRLVADATNEFESALGFGQLPWDSVTGWQTFKKWVVKIYQTDPQTFRKYAEWRLQKGKFTAMSNKQIRQSPAQFMDTGYPEFLAHSAMYNGGGNAPKPL